jgi:hypothetical protein
MLELSLSLLFSFISVFLKRGESSLILGTELVKNAQKISTKNKAYSSRFSQILSFANKSFFRCRAHFNLSAARKRWRCFAYARIPPRR